MARGTLKISKEISLPPEAATQKLAWLGTTGSGKTYGASKFAEQLWHIGAQFVALDPVGVWYGMRLAKDGKHPSTIDIPVLGGLHGDVPLQATAGKLIADLIVDKNLSVILDVSQFESDADKARFAGDFARQFYFRKKARPSAVHLFLEECQEFVPQNPQRGEEHMLHAFVRMQKLGRNFGIGSSYISQRPQEVNKKALNMAQTLFVFRSTGSHERVAIEKWIEDKALDETIANDLPKIPTGQCHIWSPEFLKISAMVHILEKETFNASATPEVGKKAKAASLSSIDVGALTKDMAEVVAQAECEDPRKLQAKVRALEVELSKRPTGAMDPKERERIVAEVSRTLNRQFEAERAMYRGALVKTSIVLKKIAELTTRPDVLAELDKAPKEPVPLPRPEAYVPKVVPTKPTTQVILEGSGDVSLRPGARKILEALASRAPMRLTKSQVGLFTKFRITGGSFTSYLSELRKSGFMGQENDLFFATEQGIGHLGIIPKSPQNKDETIAMWRASLRPGEVRILDILLAAEPDWVSKEQISVEANTSGGSFTSYISVLKKNGIIEASKDALRISPTLANM